MQLEIAHNRSSGVEGHVLGEMVDGYLRAARLRGLAPSSVDRYRRDLRRAFLPWCEAQGLGAVEEIDQDVVDRYSEHLLTRPRAQDRGGNLSRAAVVTYLASVQNFLSWARQRGIEVEGRPVLPRQPRRTRMAVTREEISLMEDAAATERDKLTIRLLGDRGLRMGELLLLDVDDLVELQRGKWFLRVRGKGRGGHGAERFVPLSGALYRRLSKQAAHRRDQAADEALFLGLRRWTDRRYHRMTKAALYQLVVSTARAAGIQRGVHPHLLRHSAITHYAGKGMNPFQLRMVFGNHSSLDVYMHLTPLDAHEWMARLEG